MISLTRSIFRKLELFRSPKVAMICAVRNNLNQMRFRGLHFPPQRSKVLFMMQPGTAHSRFRTVAWAFAILFLTLADPSQGVADPAPAAVSAFNAYIGKLEARLAEQHRLPNTFIVPVASGANGDARLRRG